MPVPVHGVDGSMASRVVMEADQIASACARMAHQIFEANQGAQRPRAHGDSRPEACRWPIGWQGDG